MFEVCIIDFAFRARELFSPVPLVLSCKTPPEHASQPMPQLTRFEQTRTQQRQRPKSSKRRQSQRKPNKRCACLTPFKHEARPWGHFNVTLLRRLTTNNFPPARRTAMPEEDGVLPNDGGRDCRNDPFGPLCCVWRCWKIDAVVRAPPRRRRRSRAPTSTIAGSRRIATRPALLRRCSGSRRSRTRRGRRRRATQGCAAAAPVCLKRHGAHNTPPNPVCLCRSLA